MSHEVDNSKRAQWAFTALDTFGSETGQRGYQYSDPEEFLEIAGDLLCDLFHAAQRAGVTPEDLVTRATDHYDAEVAEEQAPVEPGPNVDG